MSLIQRFYDPQEGSVLIGKDGPASRECIGYHVAIREFGAWTSCTGGVAASRVARRVGTSCN